MQNKITICQQFSRIYITKEVIKLKKKYNYETNPDKID